MTIHRTFFQDFKTDNDEPVTVEYYYHAYPVNAHKR